MFNILKRLNLFDRFDNLITAMSTSRQDLIEKYHNCYGAEYGKKAFEYHIGKVILYGNKDNNKYDSHWSDELYGMLKNIATFRLKSNNKYPKEIFIKDNFFFYAMGIENEFRNRIENIESFCMRDKEDPYPKGKKINWSKAWNCYKSFAEKCSKDISLNGEIKRSDFDKYLKPLFNCG